MMKCATAGLLLLCGATPTAALVATAATAVRSTRGPPARAHHAARIDPSDSRSRRLIKQAYNMRNLSYEERQAFEAYQRQQKAQIVPRAIALCLVAAASWYFVGDAQPPEGLLDIMGSLPAPVAAILSR